MERWVEYYSELYSLEDKVPEATFNAIQPLPILEELDAESTVEELRETTEDLSHGKALGEDGIPPEVIKCAKAVLEKDSFKLVYLCCNEGVVPQDVRDSNIIPLQKKKGDMSDCNSYHGISLLNIVGKLYAWVVLKRIQILPVRAYPEPQCGFRAEQSIFTLSFP